jgi:2-oxo-4-hydroxy-4-carboxy-5-ureidoimidazoline decarboxylase
MHQGIGLTGFNSMPERKAVHAIYECCNCVTLAADLAKGRPYADHAAFFARTDALLFAMSDECIDRILEALPYIGARPRSVPSKAEQCAVWAEDETVMADLQTAALRYADHFGFQFVMYVNGYGAAEVTAAIADRIHNDDETEHKILRNELAKITRTRLERMLGPEGGYQNW